MERFAEQTVSEVTRPVQKILYAVSWVLIAMFGVFAITELMSSFATGEDGKLVVNYMALILFLAGGVTCFLIWNLRDRIFVEYDYIFEDGTLLIDAVYNGKKRKRLAQIESEQISSFDKIETFTKDKASNWFLHSDAGLYRLSWHNEAQRNTAVLELNDELRDLILHEVRRNAIINR